MVPNSKEAGVGCLQEENAQGMWKEKKALAEQGRKYNSCDVLCTVLGVQFSN